MATYNGERFLKDQLLSISNQRVLPTELVICDDGSTDATLEIARKFANDAPYRVRVERNAVRLGFGDNFLHAAQLCEGECICFSDQDDVWLPNKLARFAELFERPDIVLGVHSARFVDERLTPTGGFCPRYEKFEVRSPLTNPPLTFLLGFAICFRRVLLDGLPFEARPSDVCGPESKQAHDQLVPFVANVLGSVAYLPDVLALYRRHERTATPIADRSNVQRRSILHRLRRDWRIRWSIQSELQMQAQIGEEHREFCGIMRGSTAGDTARKWESGERFYRALARRLRLRSQLHDQSISRAARVRLFGAVVHERAYHSSWSTMTDNLEMLRSDLACLV